MLKRLFDILFSLFILFLASPLFLFITLGITITSRGPVFYKGKRVGRYGKPFFMYKFRTMVLNADKIGGPTTSDDDPRITRVGKILRKYKLDELPQFINVVKSEMSVVGPRPDVEEVVRIIPQEKRKLILSVRPGITDFSSIYFPDEGKVVKGTPDAHKAYLEKIWPAKIKLQLQYVEEQSFITDIKIVLNTIKTLFFKH